MPENESNRRFEVRYNHKECQGTHREEGGFNHWWFDFLYTIKRTRPFAYGICYPTQGDSQCPAMGPYGDKQCRETVYYKMKPEYLQYYLNISSVTSSTDVISERSSLTGSWWLPSLTRPSSNQEFIIEITVMSCLIWRKYSYKLV